MAIYRTLYYGDVMLGVGGRITIPQDMRDDLRIEAISEEWRGREVRIGGLINALATQKTRKGA